MVKLTKKELLSGMVVVAICMLPTTLVHATNGITYSFSGGRFGDNLTTYVEARWLAYKTGLDFYYRPFKYSDTLNMHTIHKNYRDHDKLRIVSIEDVKTFTQKTDTLYVISPFPANNNVKWDDPIFYTMMKEEIAAITGEPKLEVPEGHLAVGVHVRRGGGWDFQLKQTGTLVTAQYDNPNFFADVEYPTRFAPDSFFIEQLEYVLEKFSDKKLYVHIFTDDPRPDLIADKYRKALANSRITFGYREEGNAHNANVLDDLFMMAQCKVLIRSASYFSGIAAHLGRVKLEIVPSDAIWDNDVLWITRATIIERDTKEWLTKWRNVPAGPRKVANT